MVYTLYKFDDVDTLGLLQPQIFFFQIFEL